MMDAIWQLTAIVIALAAIVIAAVPRRWLGRTVILWLLSPVPVYFGVAFWEAATRPATNVIGNALMGFALVSAFVLIPWVIVAGIAIVMGLLLRGMFRNKAPADPARQAGTVDGD